MERKTPSDTLMEALAEIEGAEDVVIVWRKGDNIEWDCNDVPLWTVFGMIETAKNEMAAQVAEEED